MWSRDEPRQQRRVHPGTRAVGCRRVRRCRDGGRRRGAALVPRRRVARTARDASAIATGIGPGDRVAIWAPNSWEWIVAALGALGSGAWLVPVNTRFKGDEAAYVLDRVNAAALFTVRGFLDTDYLDMLHATAPGLRCLDRVVLFAGTDNRARSFDEYLEQGADVDESAATRASRRWAPTTSPT